jgi:hypothetical protein
MEIVKNYNSYTDAILDVCPKCNKHCRYDHCDLNPYQNYYHKTNFYEFFLMRRRNKMLAKLKLTKTWFKEGWK